MKIFEISKSFIDVKRIKNVNDKFMSNKSPFGLLTNKEYERLEEERY